MSAQGLYENMPVPFQNAACSLYGLRERHVRLGRKFRSHYKSLLASDFATAESIAAYQDARVSAAVKSAYGTVPYYKRLLDELGLSPIDIKGVNDLHALPTLTKLTVANHMADFLKNGRHHRNARWVATSGSTGTPLRFLMSESAVAYQWAVWWRHRHRFGVEPLSWHANFTGRPVVPITQSGPPYWRINYPMRQVLVGMHHITERNFMNIANYLAARPLVYLSGYASILVQFSEVALRFNWKFPRPIHAVFLGAEAVDERQAQQIARVTGSQVTDQYGFAEGAGNASRCEVGNYHEDWEVGLLECVDGEVQGDGSVRGRVVATGFANPIFPFIRYEVGDVATWAPDGFRCPCGRSSRVIWSIEGRLEDYIQTPEGTRLRRFSHLFKGLNSIALAQVVQVDTASVAIRVVPSGRGSLSDELAVISSRFRSLVSRQMELTVQPLADIPRTERGKFRAVVSLERYLREE